MPDSKAERRAVAPGGGDPPTLPVAAVGARTDPPPTALFPPTAGGHVRLFGSRAYFRMWCAQVASSLGDWIGFFAIAAVAARIGGQNEAAAISLVMSARIVPGFFLAQVAGVFVDRWDRKRLMVCCDVGRAFVLVSLPFLDSLLALVLASFLLEIGTLLWSSAKEASVPNLVAPDHLTTVNSLGLAAAYGTFPLAALLGAGLTKLAERLGRIDGLAFLDINRESIAIYFDALTFLVSAMLIATLPLVRQQRSRAADERPARGGRGVMVEVREGWRFIGANRRVRAVMIAISTGLVGGGMLVPLGPVFADRVLRGGPSTFFLLLTALGFGVAAGVLVLSAAQRRIPKVRIFVAAVYGAGGSLLLAASFTSLNRSWPLVFVLGLCAGAVYVLGFTILHESVGDDLRGRVFSTLYTLVRLSLLVAFALGGLLSQLLNGLARQVVGDDLTVGDGPSLYLPGVRLALWSAGVIILAAAVLAGRSLKERT